MSVVAAIAVPHPPILVPKIGRGEERKIQSTSDAYTEVMKNVAKLRPETVVIISPHSVMYQDYFHISPGRGATGDLRAFGARDLAFDVTYDTEFVSLLCKLAREDGVSAGTEGERDKVLDHGTMIPLYFLNRAYEGCKIVRIGLSGLSALSHYRMGRCIAQTAQKLHRRVVVIASGDLSHKLKKEGPYGYSSEGPQLDMEITTALSGGDFRSLLGISPALSEAGAECGLRSLQMMSGALDGINIKAKLLSYEGTFGVGYAVAFFEPTEGNGENQPALRLSDLVEEERERISSRRRSESPYVRLARLSLETFVKTGLRAAVPEGLPEEMLTKKAGVFVSLKKHRQLRGCIGTISPVTPCVAREILRNAISAATEDPRFEPVGEDELPELEISVDVLGEAEKIESEEQLDVKHYGVIVESKGRRGLLLPNLDGVDTVTEQIAIARKKAGIAPQEKITISRFEVVRHQ